MSGPLKHAAAMEDAYCAWLGATGSHARLAAAVTLVARCNAYVAALSANLELPVAREQICGELEDGA